MKSFKEFLAEASYRINLKDSYTNKEKQRILKALTDRFGSDKVFVIGDEVDVYDTDKRSNYWKLQSDVQDTIKSSIYK